MPTAGNGSQKSARHGDQDQQSQSAQPTQASPGEVHDGRTQSAYRQTQQSAAGKGGRGALVAESKYAHGQVSDRTIAPHGGNAEEGNGRAEQAQQQFDDADGDAGLVTP